MKQLGVLIFTDGGSKISRNHKDPVTWGSLNITRTVAAALILLSKHHYNVVNTDGVLLAIKQAPCR